VVKATFGPRWQARMAAVLFDGRRFVLPALAIGYFVFWAALLAIGKAAQVIHFDSAEAYAWGQQLAWGYGKHPPLSGAIAWLWFAVFPARDWAMYALAMAVTGATFGLLWLLARRVVDRRRALLMACVVLVYPIINFKGYKYNADLALMPFIVLVVLVFTIAFERRTLAWGVALGLAGAAAVLTKYWGAWAIAAIGIAALLHPDRKAFFRSVVPYAAGAVFIVAMIPHVLWLIRDDFTPFRYAADYGATIGMAVKRAVTGSGQVLVLLLPAMLAGLVALWPMHRRRAGDQPPSNAARNLWIIVAVLAILPPITAALLAVRMKSDWDIPMYTMVPLALIAWPGLAVPLRSVARAATLALIYCVGAAIVVPLTDVVKYRVDSKALLPKTLDELAREATALWHQRYGVKLPVVAGWEPYAAPVTFYSPDHPRLFTQANPKLAPWIDIGSLDHTGFLGICQAGDVQCIARISRWRLDAERVELSSRRLAIGREAPDDKWILILAPPQPKLAAQ